MSTERTPLTNYGPTRSRYIFPGVSPRSRRKKVTQFQCCMTTIILSILGIALIITISYSLMSTLPPNSTLPSDTDIKMSSTTIEPDDVLNSSELFQHLIELDQPLEDEHPPAWALPDPLESEEYEAENFGLKSLGDKEILEEDIATVPLNTPSFRHQRAITTTPEARKLSKRGFVEYHATIYLARKNNYTKSFGRRNIGQGPRIKLLEFKRNPTCNFNAKYRTANGTCNNKRHPCTFGCAMTPFRRALQPDYGDGISTPRKSYYGKDLPSARKVSLEIHRPPYSTDSNFTVMLAVWGQFLDHDITATALTQGQDGEPINCCAQTKLIHPECFPVLIGEGDPFFDDYNITCMNFVRSSPAPLGRYGPREQLNQATAFIDGSVVYGNSDERQKLLRSLKNGELRMFTTPDNRSLLPISANPNDGCNQKEMNEQGKYCFDTGDERANENLFLTSMHLLFARHHNYLAGNLRRVNPDLNDEKLFQESRRILAAQMQHITYNEFLPILLGSELAESKKILSDPENKEDSYDPSVNPSIGNNFAAAAFRFAHTLLPGLLKVKTDDNKLENIQLHKMLFNPYSLWLRGGIDKAMGSAASTPTLKVNQYFTVELTEKLFEDTPAMNISTEANVCGLDLVSLNIQRGRDHGIPAYFEWRKYCKLPSTDTWKTMGYAVDPDSLENMRKVYVDPRDVDLYTGALSEPPLEGAIFGPLLACLVTEQFVRIKIGDSYWYERKIGPQRFTKGQLQEIYKTTLAEIICTNSDDIQFIQKFVMMRINETTNPYINCSELSKLDFKQWSKDVVSKKTSTFNVPTSFNDVLVSVVKSKNPGKLNRDIL